VLLGEVKVRRCIFVVLAFISLVASSATALYQNWEYVSGGREYWVRIETEDDHKVIACGEVLARDAKVRSEAKFSTDNIIGTLNKGELVRIYQPVQGDTALWTKSINGFTNDIWYEIWYEKAQKKAVIYASLVKEKNRTLCLN